MRCKFYRQLIDSMCQRKLRPEEQTELEAHIKECEACRRDYLAAVNITREDLALTPPELPGDFTEGVMQQIGHRALSIKEPSRSRASYFRWAAAACFAVVVILAVFLTAENMRPTPEQARADIEQTYAQARSLFDEKKFEQSIEKFNEVLEKAHSNPFIVEAGKYEDAAKFWISLARIEKDASQAFTRARLQTTPKGDLTTSFINGSAGDALTWTWKFNDGTTVVDDTDNWYGDVHLNETVWSAQTMKELEKTLSETDRLLEEGKYDEALASLGQVDTEHLQKWRDEFRRMHRDFDRVEFDLESHEVQELEKKRNILTSELREEIAAKRRRIQELIRASDYDATIELKTGGRVEGRVFGQWEDGELLVTLSEEHVKVKIDDISRIHFPNLDERDVASLAGWGIPVEKIVVGEPGPMIKGQILSFDKDTEHATLSVGKKDGIEKGYEFTVYRGAKFVACVRVMEVSEKTCRGKILFKAEDIQKGDSARTKQASKVEKRKTWKRSGKPRFARVYVGGGNSLELVRMQVNVTVEGPRARTLVDHIFYNPHDKQLQGTFEYPLPSGASPSYYAMFIGQQTGEAPVFFRESELPQNLPEMSPQEIVAHVAKKYWGELKEARIVKRETARKAYEEIVRRKIDPALLEYASANTFRGRVFPIPAKGYNRVIIAYEQTLERVDDKLRYRFPLPDCELKSLNFALTTRPDYWQDSSAGRDDIEEAKGESLFTYSGEWTKKGPGGEAVVSFTPARKDIQYISGLDAKRGPYYFYARLRPNLPEKEEKPFASRAVFLVDTSLSEEPDRFNTSVKLLAKILESDTTIEKFQVLLFDVGARWLLEPEGFWLANTQEGRKKAFARLDEVLLEGATDLSIALEKLSAQEALKDKPVNIFLLSDGQVNWGATKADQLAARFEKKAKFPHKFFCYRTGLSAENLGLFGMLSRGGGAVFNCFTEDAIAKVAIAHRSQCLQVTGVNAAGAAGVSELLVAGRKCALYPGGEMIVAGRCREAGDVVLEVSGTYGGKEMTFSFPLAVGSKSELAPRAWAEIAVASLVALNKPELDELITAYCQHFSIGSKVASFLVLETEADYKRFDISGELGEIEVKDVAGFLESQWRDAGEELSAQERFKRFVAQIEERTKLISGQSGEYVKKLLGALDSKDYELSQSLSADKVLLKAEVGQDYLASRGKRRRDVDVYAREAKRRGQKKEAGAALRALSCVVELYPGRCDALRLTACRLLEMGEPACAAGLFWRVQESRPFEPQSYRDLARSYELAGRPGLAALQYEILLAGKWHNRFLSLKQVALEEYSMLMRTAVREKSVNARLSDLFAARLAALAKAGGEADLRVTISWNTDNTDVDLWVVEPDGERCYYQHKQTKSGGTLLDDLTQGYGPERYHTQKAQKGLYTVKVHYFATNPNLLGGETYVTVTVTKFAGTGRQEVRRFNVVLKESKQAVEVCQVEF